MVDARSSPTADISAPISATTLSSTSPISEPLESAPATTATSASLGISSAPSPPTAPSSSLVTDDGVVHTTVHQKRNSRAIGADPNGYCMFRALQLACALQGRISDVREGLLDDLIDTWSKEDRELFGCKPKVLDLCVG